MKMGEVELFNLLFDNKSLKDRNEDIKEEREQLYGILVGAKCAQLVSKEDDGEDESVREDILLCPGQSFRLITRKRKSPENPSQIILRRF